MPSNLILLSGGQYVVFFVTSSPRISRQVVLLWWTGVSLWIKYGIDLISNGLSLPWFVNSWNCVFVRFVRCQSRINWMCKWFVLFQKGFHHRNDTGLFGTLSARWRACCQGSIDDSSSCPNHSTTSRKAGIQDAIESLWSALHCVVKTMSEYEKKLETSKSGTLTEPYKAQAKTHCPPLRSP